MYKSIQDFLNKNDQDNLPYTPIEKNDNDNSLMSPEDYSKLVSQDPTLFQKAKPPQDYMQKALEEDMGYSFPEGTQVQEQPKNAISPTQSQITNTPLVNKSQNDSQTPDKETDLQRLEKKLQELRDTDLERQRTASKYNLGAKAAAIIGDALSKYQAGAIQKNVATPIQNTGPSLQQLMGIIGEVKPASSAEQRQSLIDRYKELKAEQKEAGATKREKEAADLKYNRDLAILDRKIKSDEKIAQMNKASQPTFEEKKQIEADINEKKAVAKENRAIKQKLEPAIENLDTQIENIDNTIKLFKDKAGKTKTDLTGPILGNFPTISDDRQEVEKALNQISLKEMTKTFEGMASAVNSNVEREFFQAAQPSMKTNENINVKTLEAMKANLQSLKNKSKAKLQEIQGSNQTKTHPITGKTLKKVPGGWEEVD
jgi:hypothetical protein